MRFHQLRNRLLGLAGLAVVPVLVAGCGGVPGNAVATVDGDAITKTEYKHWANAVLKSSGQKDAVAPDPPDFTKCVAAKKAKLPKPGKGQPATKDADLKKQCKSENDQIRQTVLGQLFQLKWLTGEAKDLGVYPSKKEIAKGIADFEKQQFPNKGDKEKAIKDYGLTADDFDDIATVQLLSTKIRDKVVKGATVTDKDIQAYYDKNKARFAQPERRDLLVVLTKTKAKAEEAKRAIAGGQSFAAVAKKYSIDQASKAQGGKLAGVAKGQQEKALDEAVFAAKKGELSGPVKTQFGFYVFKVTKSTPASQQSLAAAKPTIKQLLTSQGQDKKIQAFTKKFQKKWRDKTECAPGYKVPDCKNGPKATPTPTAPAGTQQQPQPAPTQ